MWMETGTNFQKGHSYAVVMKLIQQSLHYIEVRHCNNPISYD